MELEQIRENMKELLKPSRFLHSIGVEEVACDLAVIYGYNIKKAEIAGILHDCARNLTDEQLLQECAVHQIPVTEVEKQCVFLLHAKVGALFAGLKYGIDDEDILSAITFHTTGRPAMTLLEKIIFAADYIEPYRKQLPRIDEIRKAVYNDLDFGVYMICENMIEYLEDTADHIDTLTVETYQYYKSLLSINNKE